MTRRGPILTLLAGALVATGLLVADLGSRSGDDAAGGTGTAATVTPAATTPAATPTPGPTPSDAPAAKPVNATWAGHVRGGGASVAIAARKGVAIAYVCDGGRIEAWLRGTAEDGELALKGAHGARLTARFGNGHAHGVVRTASRRWAFDVPVAKKPSGLYRSTQKVRGARVDAGWIVLSDGSQVGVITTDGAASAAPKLDPDTATATIRGAQLTATPIDGRTGSGF